jgi:hypothetical protein
VTHRAYALALSFQHPRMRRISSRGASETTSLITEAAAPGHFWRPAVDDAPSVVPLRRATVDARQFPSVPLARRSDRMLVRCLSQHQT